MIVNVLNILYIFIFKFLIKFVEKKNKKYFYKKKKKKLVHTTNL